MSGEKSASSLSSIISVSNPFLLSLITSLTFYFFQKIEDHMMLVYNQQDFKAINKMLISDVPMPG